MFNNLSNYIPFILIPFVGWGIIWKLKKEDDYSPLKRSTLSIGLIAFFLTEIARSFYRPYMYRNHIFDYYISDTIGNSLGTVTTIFIILTLIGKGTKNDWKIIVMVTIGLIGYELLNIPLNHPMDYRDIMATIIFGGFSFIIYLYLLKKYPKNRTS